MSSEAHVLKRLVAALVLSLGQDDVYEVPIIP